MKFWMTSEDRVLRQMWPFYPPRLIAEKIGRTEKGVRSYGMRRGLEKAPAIERKQPPVSEWVSVATRCAQEANLCPTKLLSGDRRAIYVAARRRAWKLILDSNRHYSAAGLARVSGHNHTTILYGLRKLTAGVSA